jgi:hypothetical protein
MPKLTPEQLDRACKLFLASVDGVDAKHRIDALTQADAAFMGTSLDDLRAARTLDEIAAFAHAKRIEPAELLFSLASEDVDEFTRLCEARDEAIWRSRAL